MTISDSSDERTVQHLSSALPSDYMILARIVSMFSRYSDAASGVCACVCSVFETSRNRNHSRSIVKYCGPVAWWLWQLGRGSAGLCHWSDQMVSHWTSANSCWYCRFQQQRVAAVRFQQVSQYKRYDPSCRRHWDSRRGDQHCTGTCHYLRHIWGISQRNDGRSVQSYTWPFAPGSLMHVFIHLLSFSLRLHGVITLQFSAKSDEWRYFSMQL